MEILLLLVRLFLFVIFALAGIGKLFDLKGSKKAVTDFGVPDVLAKPAAVLLPVVELSIAILLLPIQTSWFGATFGALLLLIFVGGMLWQIKQGNAPDCHCFGQIHSEPVGKKSLARNGVLLFFALSLVVNGKENQGLNIFDNSNEFLNLNIMQIILGIVIIGFLTAIVFFLRKISEQQTQIIRRVEVLELISQESGKEVERDNVDDPGAGLPIGAMAPKFKLPDINNKKVAFENLVAVSKPTLLFFVSPSCSPCEALVPEIENWQKNLKDRVKFVFISSGNVNENLDKFAGNGFKHILLQKENEISKTFGAEWTPTALLINAKGLIASRLATGNSAIKELIEKVMEEDFEDEFVHIGDGNGIKIGEKAPKFSLEDLKGNKVSNDYFYEKKTLVAYWNMNCPHCINMMEELRKWDKAKGVDDPNLLVISSGEMDAHKEMDLDSPVLIDNDNEVATELGMQGTPSAILIDKNGKIASETAVGAGRIWALLGKQK